MEKTLLPTFYLRAQTRYGGKYIARRRGRILASAGNLKGLLRVMKSRRIAHEGEVSIGYVPPSSSLRIYALG